MSHCEIEMNDGRVCGRQRNGRMCSTHYAREAAGTEMGAPVQRRGVRRDDWPGDRLPPRYAATFDEWLSAEQEQGNGSPAYRAWIARRADELAS